MNDYMPVLNDLSATLRRSHKALLDAEVENFGPISSPSELLTFVTGHERFSWLRELSKLMAQLDARRDDDAPVDCEQAGAFRRAIETLIGPRTETAPHFRKRYVAVLQQSPAAVMAHGDLRRLLDKLPGHP